jgi:hypothetical protein
MKKKVAVNQNLLRDLRDGKFPPRPKTYTIQEIDPLVRYSEKQIYFSEQEAKAEREIATANAKIADLNARLAEIYRPDAEKLKKRIEGPGREEGKKKAKVNERLIKLLNGVAKSYWEKHPHWNALNIMVEILKDEEALRNDKSDKWDDKHPLSKLSKFLTDMDISHNPDTLRRKIKKPATKDRH